MENLIILCAKIHQIAKLRRGAKLLWRNFLLTLALEEFQSPQNPFFNLHAHSNKYRIFGHLII